MLSGHSNGSPCEFIHFSAVPVSFASSPSAFASSLLSKRFASYTCTHFNETLLGIPQYTYHTRLQLRWSAVKRVRGFDTILHYSNGSVEEPHKLTCRFSCIVGQHLAVLLPYSDQELVDGHGRVDSDFAAVRHIRLETKWVIKVWRL